MLRTRVVDSKPFHLDRTGNCRTDRDVNSVYRPKGLDKERNIRPHTKCQEILKELGKLQKKTIAAHNTSTKPTVGLKKRGVNLRQLVCGSREKRVNAIAVVGEFSFENKFG